MRILVAGVGNVLRTDDAFGVVVAHRLQEMDLGSDVRVVETGIGGMALVQELQGIYDALIMIDAVDYGRPPGHVLLIEPDVIDVNALPPDARSDLLADMHLAKPERVLMLARALGVLPRNLLMVGCQPLDPDAYGTQMSAEVTAGVEVAIREVIAHIDKLRTAEAEEVAALAAAGTEDGEGTRS